MGTTESGGMYCTILYYSMCCGDDGGWFWEGIEGLGRMRDCGRDEGWVKRGRSADP